MKRSISIVMPFYNAAEYLAQSIGSILGQTYTDYELILIDDCSTDNGKELALGFQKSDSRIVLLENDKNLGLAASLNRGIAAANGHYVARMDADDLALPGRLRRQCEFMDSHPEIDLCGAWERNFGHDRNVTKYPEFDREIKAQLFFKTGVSHPLFFFRTEQWRAAGLQYDPAFKYAQDRDLLSRAARSLTMANIPEILLRYRVPVNRRNTQKARESRANSLDIGVSYFRSAYPSASDEDAARFRAVMGSERCAGIVEFSDCVGWFRDFFASVFPVPGKYRMAEHVAARCLFNFCKANSHLGSAAVMPVLVPPIRGSHAYSIPGLAKLVFRALRRGNSAL